MITINLMPPQGSTKEALLAEWGEGILLKPVNYVPYHRVENEVYQAKLVIEPLCPSHARVAQVCPQDDREILHEQWNLLSHPFF